MRIYLSEAYCRSGQIDKAYHLIQQTLELVQEVQHVWGVGVAQRTLGRIAHASANLTETTGHFKNAIDALSSIDARYELARAHLDLASVVHTQGNHDLATTHLNQAYRRRDHCDPVSCH